MSAAPMHVNMHEAKTHLSRLVEQVESGDEVVISRAGKPVARLIPFRRHPPRREPGALRGRIVIADDFDEPLPEELAAAFRGERA